MSFIKIPEGKSEVRLSDGSWVKIPSGVTEVNTDKLWKGSTTQQTTSTPPHTPEVQIDPFSETHRLIEEPVKTIQGAGHRIADVASSFTEKPVDTTVNIGKDVVGGSAYGSGDLLDMIGQTYSGGIIPAGIRIYNALTGGKNTKGALEDTIHPIAQDIKQTGVKIADNPNSATFSLASIGGLPETAAIKAAPFALKTSGKAAESVGKSYAKLVNHGTKEAIAKRFDTTVKDTDTHLSLAEEGTAKTSGLLDMALKEGGDEAKIAYGNLQTARVNAAEQTAGKGNFEATEEATKSAYNDMVETVKGLVVDDKGFNTKQFVDELEDIKSSFEVPEAVDTAITKLVKQMDSGNVQTVDGVLNVRKYVNAQLAKAKGTSAAPKWKTLKTSLDKYLKTHVDDDTMNLIDTATEQWKRTSQQGEVLDILEKNTKSIGAGRGIQKAVNWVQVQKDMKASGLNSEESINFIKITKKFAEKYGDIYYKKMSKTATTGAPEIDVITGDTMTAFARLANKIGVNRIIGLFSNDVAAQRKILKDILKADTEKEFFENVARSKNTPQAVRDEINDVLEQFSKENASRQRIDKTVKIDDKIEEQLQNMQIQKGASDLAVTKKTREINKIDAKIDKIYALIQEKGNRVPESLIDAMHRAKEDKLIKLQELELAQQRLAQKSAKLNKAKIKNNADVEELKVVEKNQVQPQLKVSNNPADLEEVSRVIKQYNPTATDKEIQIVAKDYVKRKAKGIKRSSSRASQVKEASEPSIGGSEDDAKQAVKNMFRKNNSKDKYYRDMSLDDIIELERMHNEDILRNKPNGMSDDDFLEAQDVF